MADPFVGEIRLFGFPRVPVGWVACDGSQLSISDNETLFILIGTTFGGDGVTSFKVPDLRGRVPLSQGNGPQLTPRVLGQIGGEYQHTLTTPEMPSHGHSLVANTTTGTTAIPDPTVQLAVASVATALYAPVANIPSYVVMASSISGAGTNMSHDNMMPTLTCNYCICLNGIFPQQN